MRQIKIAAMILVMGGAIIFAAVAHAAGNPKNMKQKSCLGNSRKVGVVEDVESFGGIKCKDAIAVAKKAAPKLVKAYNGFDPSKTKVMVGKYKCTAFNGDAADYFFSCQLNGGGYWKFVNFEFSTFGG